jgi:hypothetical protein
MYWYLLSYVNFVRTVFDLVDRRCTLLTLSVWEQCKTCFAFVWNNSILTKYICKITDDPYWNLQTKFSYIPQ